MTSAFPQPKAKRSAGLRLVKPGEPANSAAPFSQPAPIKPDSFGPAFVLGWNIFRITVWVTIAVWVNPRLLDRVGGEGIASWLLQHGWVRMLGVPPLGLLGLISAFELLNITRRPAAREDLALRTGATAVEKRDLDPRYGIPKGPGLSVPLGRWSMDVGTFMNKGSVHTVASVQVKIRSALSFVARGADREPAVLRGLQQFAMGYAVRHMAEHATDARTAAAAAAFAYVAEPPIAIGSDALDRAVVLRANQPDAARAMLLAGAVTSAIVALNARFRTWDWTFYPAATAGMAEMRLECPGALREAESLKLVAEVMRASLEEMARAGVVAG